MGFQETRREARCYEASEGGVCLLEGGRYVAFVNTPPRHYVPTLSIPRPVVFITSNSQGNSEIMQGCKEAMIPAFGTLWDF